MADTDEDKREDITRTENVRKHEIWVWPVVCALTVTAFIIGWVKVTDINTHRDIQVKQIEHSVSQTK